MHDRTFEEWGDLPPDRKSIVAISPDLLLENIKNGLTTAEIVEENPELLLQSDRVERARVLLIKPPKWREINAEYWFGATGTGKTRGVMSAYDADEIFRVTTYKNPFDMYSGQPVLVLDEYRGQLEISLLLNILDGYRLELPARYSNNPAMFED